MELFLDRLNVYIIPPTLAFVIGLTLAIISIVKGRVKGKIMTENILFSLVCIWWSCLLAPAFMSHHLFRGDEELILKIERVIHFFFVYVPVVNMVYFHRIMEVKRNYLIIICCIISFIISLFTPTEYYMYGLYSYNWGYIAKGGLAFNIYGLYGIIVILYMAVLVIGKHKRARNEIERRKIKYIAFSILF